MTNTIETFAKLVETDTIDKLYKSNLDCESNIANAHTTIKHGNKYTKVDIGRGGRYMVENSTGNIFGIKAYGQIHKGHFYGTLDTINDWYWGNYYPEHKTNPVPTKGGCPIITTAPTI